MEDLDHTQGWTIWPQEIWQCKSLSAASVFDKDIFFFKDGDLLLQIFHQLIL